MKLTSRLRGDYRSAVEVHMRRMIGIAFVLSLATAFAWAALADWIAVEKIKRDTAVRVELWSGQEYMGRFDSADGASFRLKVASHEQQGQVSDLCTFTQQNVRIVETFGGRSGRDPSDTIRKGALIGAAGGAVATGIAAGKAWPLGVFAGGFGGALAGVAGGGIVAVVKDAPRSHRKIVYESQQRPPVARPPERAVLGLDR